MYIDEWEFGRRMNGELFEGDRVGEGVDFFDFDGDGVVGVELVGFGFVGYVDVLRGVGEDDGVGDEGGVFVEVFD